MAEFLIRSSEFQFDAKAKGVKPGDKIMFEKGTRKNIEISNIVGEPGDEIELCNEPDGKTIVAGGTTKNSSGMYTTPFSINVYGSKHFRLHGANNPNEKFGIEIKNLHMGPDMKKLSTDFEVHNLHVHDISSVGIVCKTDPTTDPATQRGNFVMKNVRVHSNLVENVGDEGTYCGSSHYSKGVSAGGKTVQEHDVLNLVIENNEFKNTGRDGIQVGGALSGSRVNNNKIKNFATKAIFGHQSGIQVNEGSVLDIYENVIENGTGYGVFISGSSGTKAYRNVVKGSEQGAFFVNDFSPIKYDPTLIYNNTLVDHKDHAVYYLSLNSKGQFFNNIVIPDGVISKYNKNFGPYQHIRKGNAKAIITDVNNWYGSSAVGFFDENYVPLPNSKIPKGVGAFDLKQVVEVGTIEVIDGSEIWVVFKSGRIRLK